MSTMKITLIGMENHYNATYNKSLFDDINIPSGIDSSILRDSILLDLGEYEILYANMDFFKSAINQFFNKHNRTFTKWIEALNIEYSPLENYDRKETWSDSGTNKSESSGTSSVDNSTQTSGENKVSAFDSSSYQPDSQSTATSSGHTGSQDTATNNINTSANHDGRVHGNIGVTTSQQMLQAELDIDTWNIYQHITDLFGVELLIMVED